MSTLDTRSEPISLLADTAEQTASVEQALLLLVQLEVKAREADSLQALQFICLNETYHLVSYRQSLLWRADSRQLVGASGLADVDASSPFCTWVNGLCHAVAASQQANHIHHIDPNTLQEHDALRYVEYFPEYLIWLPILSPNGHLLGGLLLAKEQSLRLREKNLLMFLLGAYGHAWQGFLKKKRFSLVSMSWKRRLCVLVLLIGVLSIPVRQSVIAPADVVPVQPSIARAPINGVVSELLVKPNDTVRAGQPLIRLDARELQQQLEVARQSYAISRAELRMAQQQSFSDGRRKAELAILEGKRDKAQLDVSYLQKKLERTLLVAPHAGVAIYDNQGDWLGKPLNLGDAIMTIADPNNIQLAINLPLKDAIELHLGSNVLFFLNSDPSHPIHGTLTKLAYKATPTGEGEYALRVNSAFVDQDRRLRLGKKGQAKLYGENTSLFYYLFRRPISELRMWLTW